MTSMLGAILRGLRARALLSAGSVLLTALAVASAVLGTIFIVLLPEAVSALFRLIGGPFESLLSTGVHEVKSIVYGLIIILFLRFEPRGLVGLWRDAKRLWVNWPLRY